MRQLSAAVVVLLLSCGAASAQVMSTTPIPPASPLGIPGTIGSTPPTGSTGMGGSSAGIGLGATGIDPGGLSPAVSPTCNLGSSSSGTASTGMSASGAGAAFDGGGMSATGSAGMTSGSCATGSVGPATVGTALSPSSPGSTAGSIPLGATELNNAGVSPMIGVPAPSIGLPAPGTTMGGATGLGLPGTSSRSTGGSSTGF
jgi:collagen type VII alpha